MTNPHPGTITDYFIGLTECDQKTVVIEKIRATSTLSLHLQLEMDSPGEGQLK